MTADAVKNRLAALFDVDASLVTYTTVSTVYGPAATYRYNGQNRVRVGMFGGSGSTWNASRLAAIAYVRDNAAAWGE